MNPGRWWTFPATVGLSIPVPGWAQQPTPAVAVQIDTVAIDACTIAPAEQLRFVVTAGLAQAFPVREQAGGATLSLGEPSVVATTCPGLKVAVALTLREDAPDPPGDRGVGGSVRVALSMGTTASFRRSTANPPRSAPALTVATLCVRRVDPLGSSLRAAPTWLTPAWLASRLSADLVGRACFDVTSLVYVVISRGGRLRNPP